MFISESNHYKPSRLNDHTQTECHKRTVRGNNEMHARASSISLYVQKVVQTIPEDLSTKKYVKKTTINEHRHWLSYFILLIP